MKKVVLNLDLPHDKAKQKAMETVSTFSGVDSISVDMNNNKLTVTGDIDPVHLVRKLRKRGRAEIVSVGPAKEEKKKEEPKKDDKKDNKDSKDKKKDDESELAKLYRNHNPYMGTLYYVGSAEEDPNSCVIC